MVSKLLIYILILFYSIIPGIANAAMPPTIIYKTKANYNDLVPIGLSKDKSKIINYPGPSDVYYMGKLAYPTKLSQGYLLDNRGIRKNSAFLDITYEQYSQLDKIPSHEDFFNLIKDSDPFLEIYNCDSKPFIVSNMSLNATCDSLIEQTDSKKYLLYWILGIGITLMIILYLFFKRKNNS